MRSTEPILRHLDTTIAHDWGSLGLSKQTGFEPRQTSPRPLSEYYLHSRTTPGQLGATARALLDYTLRCETKENRGDIVEVRSPTEKELSLLKYPTEVCPFAELAFDDVLTQVKDFVEDNTYTLYTEDPQPKISVYHDANGEPYFLRKSIDASTALALRAMRTDNGMPIPAGTIVGLPRLSVTPTTGLASVPYDTTQTTWRTIEFDPNRHPVLPLRLSPWSFDRELDRGLYGVSYFDPTTNARTIDWGRHRIATTHTIDSFRSASAIVTQACQQTLVNR